MRKVMKIIVFHPSIKIEDPMLAELNACGVGVLCTHSMVEAFNFVEVHGTSLDLAIVHEQPGLNWLKNLRVRPGYESFPYVMLTSTWSEAQCAAHQNTALGANAYLTYPCTGAQLKECVEAVMGETLTRLPASEIPVFKSSPVKAASVEGGKTKTINKTPVEISGAIHALEKAALKEQPDSRMEGTDLIELAPVAGPPVEAVAAPPIEISKVMSLVDIQAGEPPAAPPPVPDTAQETEQISEPDFAAEMPFLFGEKKPQPIDTYLNTTAAVGGMPATVIENADVETLKKYLLLREKDAVALSGQLAAVRGRMGTLEKDLQDEKLRCVCIQDTVESQKQKIQDYERENQVTGAALYKEIEALKFQEKMKVDRIRILEKQLQDSSKEIERVKDRVKADIRKIRVHEKELENRLEVQRKDSEALLTVRENRIVDLKRKIDLLEFNMDLLQDRYNKEKEKNMQLSERLEKAAKVVRVMGGMLDDSPAMAEEKAPTVTTDNQKAS